jgi:large-conductance mechanosensitive channel
MSNQFLDVILGTYTSKPSWNKVFLNILSLVALPGSLVNNKTFIDAQIRFLLLCYLAFIVSLPVQHFLETPNF